MIGVIADDLTGAAELGAIGRQCGLRAELIHAGPVPRADLVCFNTDSRSCRPAIAARRAAAAARILSAAGAEWIYKKTDSVLRGPVTAELEGILKQLGLKLALLLPANPSLGRTIRSGHYYIRGRPIHRTEFARDPEHPRRSSDVTRLLEKIRMPVHVRNVRETLPDSGIVVAEADAPAAVKRWARRRSAELLPAGGADFFRALLRHDGHAPSPQATVSIRGRELFVCGSTSESTRRLVAENKARGIPVFSLPMELARGGKFRAAVRAGMAGTIAAAFGSHRRVILNVGLPPVRAKRIAVSLAIYLAQLAASVLRRTAIARVFAEGGATAMALVHAAGWRRLTVLQQDAPGVGTLAVDGGKPWLTIKPGSYAWPERIRTRH
jgi:uncharacterized protein YgbK (DUF1537 family)